MGDDPHSPPAGIFFDAPLAEREREYSPSSCIGGHYQPFIEAYRHRSVAARRSAAARGGHWTRHAHGPAASQGIELCLPRQASPAAPVGLLLFVHGGYWQELSAGASLFAAEACVARGLAFAALDYTLAPQATLAAIIDECRAALAWLGARAAELGLDRERVVIAGSSAGAHLGAMMALADCGAPARITPKAVVLVSGIYWLSPLIGTSIDQALHLDARSARDASPALQSLAGFPPALVCWGEVETAAFKQQSRAFAARLREAGTRCTEFEVPMRNHFDVILDLADVGSSLGHQALSLV